MGFRNALATNVTPLMLRLGLAAIFLWAGTSKLFYSNTAVGEEAALLANLGVIAAPTVAAATPAPTAEPAPAPSEPAPAESPPEEKPAEEKPAAAPEVPQTVPPAMVALTTLAQAGSGSASVTPAFTAEQFPEPVAYKRLHGITVLLHQSAKPDANGHRLWPAELSSPRMLRLMAWLAALTEFFGGVLVLIGFLTRVWALGLAGTMVVAMLLTTVGPAAIGPDPFLGLLPQPRMSDPQAWGSAWQTMMTQWITLMAAVGLLCSGAGAFSVDRLVFGGRGGPARTRDEDDLD